eukprot:CAMPEP_0176422118 /NCGR_PEP_ID=MMETSP0127-20121128/9557_1 /TAXON_ID=938130 /ORGANISM="Platyophrya macrostoma, Strain WH" /LENGTH=204 /DNA_ID=CAMNT_0017802935 /DNA_START=156 /DNA_END=770 /DNA_ORIENTATION=+
MSKHFEIVLYTASCKEYAEAVLKTLKIRQFFSQIYHREHCKLNAENKYIKNLSVIGVQLSDVILVDDSPVQLENQPENVLIIKSFQGENDDDKELSAITDFLISRAGKAEVRPVMEAFNAYKKQDKTENLSKDDFQLLKRELKVKCLQKLQIVSKKSQSSTQNTECDEEIVQDDFFERDFAQKLPQMRTARLSLKLGNWDLSEN